MSSVAMGGRRVSVPGNKVAAGVVWLTGLTMTYAALNQMTDWPVVWSLVTALAIQAVLTIGQSPVWHGRGGMVSYTMLVADALINFGGVMAVLANLDQMGSVQALSATFADYYGPWPMWIKGVLAVAVSAIIAGLPEYLWGLD